MAVGERRSRWHYRTRSALAKTGSILYCSKKLTPHENPRHTGSIASDNHHGVPGPLPSATTSRDQLHILNVGFLTPEMLR